MHQTAISQDLKVTLKARVKLLPCSESVPEPCLSCGRVDQPERLHTHPHLPREDTGEIKREADRHRHKSPLKVREENRENPLGLGLYMSDKMSALLRNKKQTPKMLIRRSQELAQTLVTARERLPRRGQGEAGGLNHLRRVCLQRSPTPRQRTASPAPW